MIGISVRNTKHEGGLDVLLRRISVGKTKKMAIGVGYEDTSRSDDSGITNGELARIHEYGSEDGRVPPRPFLRPTFYENKAKYAKRSAMLYKAYLHGKEPSLETALNKLGIEMTADVRRRIMKGIDPKLAARTLRYKKRAGYPRPGIPLLATMQLYYAIRHRMVK